MVVDILRVGRESYIIYKKNYYVMRGISVEGCGRLEWFGVRLAGEQLPLRLLGRVVTSMNGQIVQLGSVGLPDSLLLELSWLQWVLDVALAVVRSVLERL